MDPADASAAAVHGARRRRNASPGQPHLARECWRLRRSCWPRADAVVTAAQRPSGRSARPSLPIEAPSTTNASVALSTPGIAVSHDGRSIAWAAENGTGASPCGSTSSTPASSARCPTPTVRRLRSGRLTAARWAFSRRRGSRSWIWRAATSARSRPCPRRRAAGPGARTTSSCISARYALYQIPAAGGASMPVATLNRAFQENSLRYPRFLPDGRHFLYVARSGRSDQSGAYVGSLDGTSAPGCSRRRCTCVSCAARLSALRERRCARCPHVRRPDARRRQRGGDRGLSGGRQCRRDERAIRRVRQRRARIFPPRPWPRRCCAGSIGRDAHWRRSNAPETYANFRVGPDDRRVVVDLASDRVVGRDVWVLNPGAAPTRMTFGGSDDWWPFWSPDGQRVAFMSYRNGVADFYVKTVNGAASEEPLVISDAQKAAGDWSRDGRFVTYWVDRRNPAAISG